MKCSIDYHETRLHKTDKCPRVTADIRSGAGDMAIDAGTLMLMLSGSLFLAYGWLRWGRK